MVIISNLKFQRASYLLDVHQESLVLRSPRVGVQHRGAEVIDERPGDASDETPVYREPNLVDDPVSYPETAHAAGDHRVPFDRTPRGADAHHVAAPDVLFARQRLGYLDEEMRLQLVVGRDVLRPVMEMLREPVRGPDVRERFGGTERVEVAAKDFRGRIMA